MSGTHTRHKQLTSSQAFRLLAKSFIDPVFITSPWKERLQICGTGICDRIYVLYTMGYIEPFVYTQMCGIVSVFMEYGVNVTYAYAHKAPETEARSLACLWMMEYCKQYGF